MKIRKGLLAAATAATVSLTGVVAAPAFAAETSTPSSTAQAPAEKTNNQDKDNGGKTTPASTTKREPSQTALDMFYDKKDGQYVISPSKIVSWIGVFTSALAAIGTFIAFLDKNFGISFN